MPRVRRSRRASPGGLPPALALALPVGLPVALLAALLAASLLLLAGCGKHTGTSPAAGVDGLTIPTPSPHPADFAEAVTTEWFPLPAGDRRAVGSVTMVVGEPTEVAGVPATPVTFETVEESHTDLFAQDDDGNVWWFGRDAGHGEPSWRAGEDGARAGLFLAAVPRFGDGHRTAYLPGVVEGRAEVIAVEGDTVRVRYLDDVRPGEALTATFRRGEGLVDYSG